MLLNRLKINFASCNQICIYAVIIKQFVIFRVSSYHKGISVFNIVKVGIFLNAKITNFDFRSRIVKSKFITISPSLSSFLCVDFFDSEFS